MPSNPLIKDRPSPLTPEGRPTSTWRSVLEFGSKLLQDTSPMHGFDIYVVGFHCARHDMTDQCEAHHYCKVVNEDLLQCVVFDGNTRDANMIGLEYIISGTLFDGLPEDERERWHPHNHEILSGELMAPGLPEAAETALMKLMLNSYGKTWHTWHTGRHDQGPGDTLPYGDARLMWSFNRSGEADARLIGDRDRALGTSAGDKAVSRRELAADARPQHGVDAMFVKSAGTTLLPGVADAGAPGSTRKTGKTGGSGKAG